MKINFPTSTFIVYRSTTPFNLLQRYRLNILLAVVMIGLFFFQFYLSGVLYEALGKPTGFGWVILVSLFIVWLVLFILLSRFLNGKLIPVGFATLSVDGIKLEGFTDQMIPFDQLSFLSTDYERPETQWGRRPPAKSYAVQIVTNQHEKFKFVVARQSNDERSKRDIIDILQYLRRQNHDLYKALRGVKRDYTES